MSITSISYPELNLTITSGTAEDTSKDLVSVTLTSGKQITLTNSLEFQPNVLTLSVTLGIKQSGKADFTVMKLPAPAATVGVFTKNRCPSVTVLRNRECLKDKQAQLIVINSGNANVFTPTGDKDLSEKAKLLSKEFGVPENEIVICSTGVIGVPLPMDKFRAGIPGLASALLPQNLDAASQAILTTDKGPKVVSVKVGNTIVSGIAKGAGMIEPNLATMLVYIFTNAKFTGEVLDSALKKASQLSFNQMSIDSDTSTSDSVVLASTAEIEPDVSVEDFERLLSAVCVKLMRDIVSGGEGVTKIIEAHVATDGSAEEARVIARSIINSPLVKSAAHGGDPNWGRIVMAIGKTNGEALVDPFRLQISLQGVTVYSNGEAVPFERATLSARLRAERIVQIQVHMGQGRHSTRAWGCDLSEEYVTENSEYTT